MTNGKKVDNLNQDTSSVQYQNNPTYSSTIEQRETQSVVVTTTADMDHQISLSFSSEHINRMKVRHHLASFLLNLFGSGSKL